MSTQFLEACFLLDCQHLNLFISIKVVFKLFSLFYNFPRKWPSATYMSVYSKSCDCRCRWGGGVFVWQRALRAWTECRTAATSQQQQQQQRSRPRGGPAQPAARTRLPGTRWTPCDPATCTNQSSVRWRGMPGVTSGGHRGRWGGGKSQQALRSTGGCHQGCAGSPCPHGATLYWAVCPTAAWRPPPAPPRDACRSKYTNLSTWTEKYQPDLWTGMPFFLLFPDFRIFHQSSIKIKFSFFWIIICTFEWVYTSSKHLKCKNTFFYD